MQSLTKFVSRRLLIVCASIGIPVVYHSMSISENVTLSVVGICGAYILGRAYSDKKTG